MYSSATFYHPEQSLDQASTAKLEGICQKLHCQPEDHILEIGTGWGGFATNAAINCGCLNSLAWLQSRLVLAAVLAGLSSPLSYLAAARLGAVGIVTESWLWFVGPGLSWALALPLLLWLASYLKKIKQEEQADV